jgi:hypothetical protein
MADGHGAGGQNRAPSSKFPGHRSQGVLVGVLRQSGIEFHAHRLARILFSSYMRCYVQLEMTLGSPG